MNPTAPPQQPPLPPPPQAPPLIPPPLQPHRPSTSCDRHPEENFTGFCPSCLCERLAVLDPNNPASSASSSSRKPLTSSTAAAALKAIFRPSAGGGTGNSGCGRGNRPPTSSSSFFPELRRTKSFSASKNEGFSGVFEPQRRSCDVRVRSTLYSLFNQDDERKKDGSRIGGTSGNAGEVEIETRNLAASSSVQGPVIETKEEEDDEDENHEITVAEKEEEENEDKVRVLEEPSVGHVIEGSFHEIVVEEEEPVLEVVEEEQLKAMKDHIDLDSQAKKTSGRDFKEIAGSVWAAASVFSKKLQKWRQKQKMKKQRNGGGSATLPVEKPIGRQFRETQSEIADYGFGRRSCDTDPRFSLDAGPRFSLDAGRVSFDDPRYSFEEPRASWDGYLIGRTFQRMPTMLSVVEDAPVQQVLRTDTQIPVEEPMNAINEDETIPGGSAQTREYYSDSSSRRRKSLDRSSSIRKTAASVVAEMEELKPVSSANSMGSASASANAKVIPAAVDYLHHGSKMVYPDRDLRDSNSNSLRDDCSETYDVGVRDNASLIGSNGDRKGTKKSRRWTKAWNIWGLIHRRGGNKYEDEENRYSGRANGGNGVERSYSESWQDLRRQRNGDLRGGAFNGKVLRSNSSVSWRNAQSIGGGSFGTLRNNDIQGSINNGHGRKARDEFVLDRNRSARYSPNNIDSGLLRFYLPMTAQMRGGSGRRNGSGKGRSNQAHSIARSVLGLY